MTQSFNDPAPEGVGFYEITVRNGFRFSAADAFLRPALRRANCSLQTRALAQHIVFGGNRATGVQFSVGDRVSTVLARREVIVSAGTVNSPKLLQLSGIGPGDLLKRHNIPVVADITRVGGNLQDHLAVSYHYRARQPTLNNILGPLSVRARAALRYALTRTGPLALSINQCGGLVRARQDSPRPDVQLYFNPFTYSTIERRGKPVNAPDPYSGFLLSFQPCRPTSRGRIDIRSGDPAAPPLITPNYLSTERDVSDVIAGGRLLQRLLATQAMQAAIAESRPPLLQGMTDEAIVADFRERCGTVYHPVGTCLMGPNARTSVVDPALRVHGVEGVRVIDASVFPNITSGNTNAPAIMVGQKGADLVIGGISN